MGDAGKYNSGCMSILKVSLMGHPALRSKARTVSQSMLASASVQQLIDDMMATMDEYNGVGLAAPQVHSDLRLFVASLDMGRGDDPSQPVAIINPDIMPVGNEIVEDWEGCLSIPDIRGRVPRHREIKVKGLDREGRKIELRARGFSARVIQHETDHLDGILFFDRMKSFETLTYLEEYSRYWSKKDDEDEE